MSGPVPHEAGSGPNLRAARRQLLLDTAGIAVSAVGFGFVFGLAARWMNGTDRTRGASDAE